MKYLFFSVILLSFNTTVLGQAPNIMFTNAQKIDEDRYKGFDGSPYLFKEWPLADIFDSSGKAFQQLELNINGYSNEIEIRKDAKFIELDKMDYTRIEIKSDGQDIVLVRGIDGLFQNEFVQQHYTGVKRKLVSRFEVQVTEKEFNDVGKTIKIKRFDPKTNYFLIQEGKAEEVKLKIKALYSYLGNKEIIDAIIADKKLKIGNPESVATLLAALEEKGL